MTGAEGLVGEVGRARTAINPTGSVLVHGEIWRAQAAAEAIEAGEKVTVESMDGFTLTVSGKEQDEA